MFSTDDQFEDEVRRIARLLWPSAEYDGAAMEGGRERDGVFETDDFVNVIECTVSRGMKKAEGDAEKIGKLLRSLSVRHPTKFVKGWFITLEEPTADQRGAVKSASARSRQQIVALSFDQFRAKVVDGRSYLEMRKLYPFGSVRDPVSGNTNFDPRYIPLEVLRESGERLDLSLLASELGNGRTVVLLGDYGAGKSATLRQLYFQLGKSFWENRSSRFPLFLNLRDHHGQTDPDEALERHARRIGFGAPASLVRAWRAGFVVLFLDGFDEIAAAGWAGKTKTLRDLRFRSMELLRNFVRETPTGTGVIISGRAHFFDSNREMATSLSLARNFLLISLSEFREEQVKEFLGRVGWNEAIPEWLPSRPLLLAYLAARGLLAPVLQPEVAADPASGWDGLLSRVAEREAELEAGIDPESVRRLIENLAMLARASVDGLGPLSPEVVVGAFRDVCGYSPDDRGAVLLQRLPGLGAHHSEDGSRVFVDRDFAEAARGGALFRTIENPYEFRFATDLWQDAVRPLAA